MVKKGDRVRIIEGKGRGRSGTVIWLSKPKRDRPQALRIRVGKRTEITTTASCVESTDGVRLAEPSPTAQGSKPPTEPKLDRNFPDPIPRPDPMPALQPLSFEEPSPLLTRVPQALAIELELDKRIYTSADRPFVGARLLAPAQLDAILEALDDPEIGVRLDQFGWFPGLGAWLRWPGLARVRHLSFDGGFLGKRGLEWLLATRNVGQLRSLNLGSCDIGHGGLQLLRTTDAMPDLEALYLGANTDHDKTKWNARAINALLKPTRAKPLGRTLQGLKVLSLESWTVFDDRFADTGFVEILTSSEVVRGLQVLHLGHLWHTAKTAETLRDTLAGVEVVYTS